VNGSAFCGSRSERWFSRTLWGLNQMNLTADSGTHDGPLSSALARTFRGKLCDVILQNRNATTFQKDQVIYDAGDENQTFFFLQKGFVKVGSITEDGHELIYDVRKAGDIVGALAVDGPSGEPRSRSVREFPWLVGETQACFAWLYASCPAYIASCIWSCARATVFCVLRFKSLPVPRT